MRNYPFKQVIVSLSGNKKDDLKFLYAINEQSDRFEENNEISYIMLFVNDPIVFFSSILIWLALGFGIFSAYYFITSCQ